MTAWHLFLWLERIALAILCLLAALAAFFAGIAVVAVLRDGNLAVILACLWLCAKALCTLMPATCFWLLMVALRMSVTPEAAP